MTTSIIAASDDRVALIEPWSGESLSYERLAARVSARCEEIRGLEGRIVFLGAANTIDAVVDMLSLMDVGATVALLDPATPREVFADWLTKYEPEAWWGFANFEERQTPPRGAAERRLERVLLATSGSTGSPKFVRLSENAVLANAGQIVRALEIDETARAMAHLPLHYSYGLSVLTSHLAAGASVLLSPFGPLQPEFWTAVAAHRVTSIPGVPYHYEMFERSGLWTRDLPGLRDLTQAGGRLAKEKVLAVESRARERGRRFWVMYGQTEATARISVLHHRDLPSAAGSVGRALPGASIEIHQPSADGTGEVVLSGPNVMLGYAESRRDIDGSDRLEGRLHTGDLGRLDADGRLWITGRIKRIAKVYGTRVSLDDVESKLGKFGNVAVVDDPNGIAVFLEPGPGARLTAREVEHLLGLPLRSVRVTVIDGLPRTQNGKVDYSALRSRS